MHKRAIINAVIAAEDAEVLVLQHVGKIVLEIAEIVALKLVAETVRVVVEIVVAQLVLVFVKIAVQMVVTYIAKDVLDVRMNVQIFAQENVIMYVVLIASEHVKVVKVNVLILVLVIHQTCL